MKSKLFQRDFLIDVISMYCNYLPPISYYVIVVTGEQYLTFAVLLYCKN